MIRSQPGRFPEETGRFTAPGLCAAVNGVTFTQRHKRWGHQSLLASLLCPLGCAPVSRAAVLSPETPTSSPQVPQERHSLGRAEERRSVGCARRRCRVRGVCREAAGRFGCRPWPCVSQGDSRVRALTTRDPEALSRCPRDPARTWREWRQEALRKPGPRMQELPWKHHQ